MPVIFFYIPARDVAKDFLGRKSRTVRPDLVPQFFQVNHFHSFHKSRPDEFDGIPFRRPGWQEKGVDTLLSPQPIRKSSILLTGMVSRVI